MKIYRIRNLEEYRQHKRLMEDEYSARRAIERGLLPRRRKNFKVPGYSYPAGRTVKFHADFVHAFDEEMPNWRETLRCPVTNLNNRLRASVHLLDFECAPYDRDRIFITEQVTAFFKYLSTRFRNVTGSEYVGKGMAPGGVTPEGIRHEDLTALSFPAGSFNFLLSFDCLEHIPDYRQAFNECCRVLAPNGVLLLSVPFAMHSRENIIRARVSPDGNVEHLLEPEYHGDPMKKEGCLCYQYFGWEFLDELKSSGFRDAYALLYWSRDFGYLGGEQILFVARK